MPIAKTPSGDNKEDHGTPTKRWRFGYYVNILVSAISASGVTATNLTAGSSPTAGRPVGANDAQKLITITAIDNTTIGQTGPVAGTFTTLSVNTSANIIAYEAVTHNYGGAADDWVLTTPEAKCELLTVTNANGAVNAIVPAAAASTRVKPWIVRNTSGQALTVKVAGQTGVTIASTKTAILAVDNTDVFRVTADA